jgi:glycosyltransferase involved in cell wall biosynthesis
MIPLSILLPFRDAKATLLDAVASIRNQTFTAWELLLLNDGSLEELPVKVMEQIAADKRIRLLNLPRSGIVAALHAGMEASAGEWIARMDADDLCHPQRLEKQVTALEDHPEWDLVSCRVGFGGDREKQCGYAAHVDWLNGLLTQEDMYLNRFVDAPVAHPSVLFRRAAFNRFGGYRVGPFPEDFELWLRWFGGGAVFGKVNQELLIWNDPPDRLSRTDPRYAQEAFYRVKCDYLTRALPENRAIWLWGAGRPTRKRFALLDRHRPFSGYVDVDPKKTGRSLHGRPVVQPEEIPENAFVLLGVASPGAREASTRFMESTGRAIGVDFLPAA